MAYGQPYTGILSVFWSSLHINSKRNFLINEVNRNILLTLGKKIKRDSIISVNENRIAYINK